MTTEKRITIEFKDITAVEIHCKDCGSVVTRKLLDIRTWPQECGNCGAIWHVPNTSEGRDMLELLQRVARHADVRRPYDIRLQVAELEEE